MPIPIVDSHIHLFPESHLPTLAWYTPDSPGPLGAQHSVEQYREATKDISTTSSTASETTKATYLRGFIFVETDRLSSITESNEGGEHGWKHALDEVSFLARIAAGNPLQGEGHSSEDSRLCLGIIPWAPVPGGPDALEKYITLMKERATNDEIWSKIRGVRYLVQDKPSGVMLQPAFIEGLKWLGRQGLSFDLGVDARQGGFWQLEEAVQMLMRAFEGVDEKERVTIVINHLCKPNLRLKYTSPESVTTHTGFLQWKAQVLAMAQYPTAYMKLSGSFSELPPLSPDSEPDIISLVEKLQPWTDVIFDAFSPERVMFGSDWPVCNVGGGGNRVSWSRWIRVVEGLLERRGLDEEQRGGFWGGVALKAYGVKI
ncbi:hypothetical protein BDV12DRAFT_209060 [Aspergillus spectabilis]